jgi:HlyD family secretion protein
VLRQSELAEAQALVELKKIRDERASAQEVARATLEGLALEMKTLRQELEEARRKVQQAAPKATRPGVLTWSLTEEGTSVRRGDVLARVADLSSFRVEATVSDVHAKRLVSGLPVAVKVGEETLDGVLSGVLPTIRNGIITVQVALEDKSNPLLRSNLRVDVLIVTGHRAKSVRIRRGPFAGGEGPVDAFVIGGSRAEKRRVVLGIVGFDEFEVVSGLAPGDEVIISDMTDYMHLDSIRIK